MLTFSHCLRTKNAPKEVANAYRGESRGISVEIEVLLKVNGISRFVLLEPSLLYHTLLLGPARFTALPISALVVHALYIAAQGNRSAMRTCHML